VTPAPAVDPLDRVLARLQNAKRNGAGWVASCPAHEDRNPSLSVASGSDGRVLLRCFAGCAFPAVVAALGLDERELFAEAPRRPESEARREYEIRDAAGKLVATHVRVDTIGAGKRFLWLRDGKAGLDGLKCADLPLFGSERLQRDPDAAVTIAEGEKAALAVRHLGSLALGTVTGASSCPSATALEVLRGRDVLLWPDCDAPGFDHMRRVGAALRGIARSVRVIEWAAAPAAGDAADFVNRHGTAERLHELVEAAASFETWAAPAKSTPAEAGAKPKAALVAYTFDELRTVEFPPRPALLCHGQEGIVRAGSIGQIYAPRGHGKSLLASSIALCVAAAPRCGLGPWHAPEAKPVLLVDGEMPSPMIRDRLALLAEGMGITSAPLLRVVASDWQTEFLPRLDTVEGQSLIEPQLDGAALVIIDNRSALFDPASETDPEAWAPAQAWLLSLRKRGMAVLVVHHANRQGGARGHSKPEDVMDMILKLSRPEDYLQEQGARFRLEFDKARGFFGDAAAPFVAQLVDGAWRLEGAPKSAERKIREEILRFIEHNPGVSKGRIVGNISGREQKVRRMLDDLAAEGVLRKEDGLFYAA
jgi:putative DNA primase/helicase